MILRLLGILYVVSLSFSCDSTEITSLVDNSNSGNIDSRSFNILSLGDSYTIGESVCEACSFPEQLKTKLEQNLDVDNNVNLDIIARTGWTTSDLILYLNTLELQNSYDIVTLLIGVNNQYQNGNFSLYENEFPELVDKAIIYAQGNINKVVVISIPDYAFTPFGQNWNPNPQSISNEIEQYNVFAETYCNEKGISFVYITDISRLGLEQPALVANDGLHPSKLAYSKFVERILPVALEKL